MKLSRILLGLTLASGIASSCHGQSWSGIVAPARAIDWGSAGLPATLPDGETTPNPWTPPTRPACTSGQAGQTVPLSSSLTTNQIIAALQACVAANPNGSYLQFGNGTFDLGSGPGGSFFRLAEFGLNNITIRGNGPQNTTFANAVIQLGTANGGDGGGTVTGSPAKGTTSVTITGALNAPTVGNLAWFTQCDTGHTSTGVFNGTFGPTLGCTGSYADNGGLFICFHSSICNLSGGDADPSSRQSQQQVVRITSVTNNGGGSYTVGFAPGLYMPNWSASNTVGLIWTGPSNVAIGDGIENATLNAVISSSYAYASWVKGCAFVLYWNNGQLSLSTSKNLLIANNYFLGLQITPSATSGSHIVSQGNSDNLILNNIFTYGITEFNGAESGNVFAYNYSRDVVTTYYQAAEFEHASSGVPELVLDEGNIGGTMLYDDTWATHVLSTTFRNWWSCGNEPYVVPATSEPAIQIGDYARFMNLIGNVLGGQSNACSFYKGTVNNNEIQFNPGSDALAASSAMLWGQYDAVNGSQRFDSAEVPTTLTGAAVPFENSVPASHALPASFYMNSMTAHPSGGTGLSWWKVCTNYPTCSTTSTPPMPPIHPESTGGAYLSGHVDATPAYLAYNTLPILSSYQTSYTITGSSWSGGTETLTITGAPSGNSFLGGFQLSGAAGACSTGAALPNGEILMTASDNSNTSATTIKYALASNPGTCSGTILWPDVRQFSETVYMADSGSSPASTPTFSPVAGTYTSAQTVTISCTTPSPTMYYTTNGTTPTTGSTVYSTPLAVSTTQTVKAICTASGYTNSAVGSSLYTINIPSVPSSTIHGHGKIKGHALIR